MALFGAPIAHEDHAQRACYAALSLQERAAALRARGEAQPRPRLRHAHGPASRATSWWGRSATTCAWTTPRRATPSASRSAWSRSRSRTRCYLSGATAALVSGYLALDDLGAVRGEGRLRPRARVRAARARRGAHALRHLARPRPQPLRRPRRGSAYARRRARAGAAPATARCVGIVAEAGTGKSRLCFEFTERCRARGLRGARGAAVAHGKNLPLLPILQVFRAVLRHRRARRRPHSWRASSIAGAPAAARRGLPRGAAGACSSSSACPIRSARRRAWSPRRSSACCSACCARSSRAPTRARARRTS